MEMEVEGMAGDEARQRYVPPRPTEQDWALARQYQFPPETRRIKPIQLDVARAEANLRAARAMGLRG